MKTATVKMKKGMKTITGIDNEELFMKMFKKFKIYQDTEQPGRFFFHTPKDNSISAIFMCSDGPPVLVFNSILHNKIVLELDIKKITGMLNKWFAIDNIEIVKEGQNPRAIYPYRFAISLGDEYYNGAAHSRPFNSDFSQAIIFNTRQEAELIKDQLHPILGSNFSIQKIKFD